MLIVRPDRCPLQGRHFCYQIDIFRVAERAGIVYEIKKIDVYQNLGNTNKCAIQQSMCFFFCYLAATCSGIVAILI
jgi:hypothetical protein